MTRKVPRGKTPQPYSNRQMNALEPSGILPCLPGFRTSQASRTQAMRYVSEDSQVWGAENNGDWTTGEHILVDCQFDEMELCFIWSCDVFFHKIRKSQNVCKVPEAKQSMWETDVLSWSQFMTFALCCLFAHVTHYCLVTGNLLLCIQEVSSFGIRDVLQMIIQNGHSQQGLVSLCNSLVVDLQNMCTHF